jgi:hypothetical protein
LEELVEPVAKDSNATATAAIKNFFVALANHKAGRKPFISGVLRGWNGEANAIVREKMGGAVCVRLAPLLATIIRRGCERHELEVSDPHQAARTVLVLTQELGDILARGTLSEDRATTATWIPRVISSTTEAIERILLASPGSILIAEFDTIKIWFADGEERR